MVQKIAIDSIQFASRLYKCRFCLEDFPFDFQTFSIPFFESVEMLRKFLLTSVVLVVAPNTRIQLWCGLVTSIAFLLLTNTLRPYRDPLPALVQTLALLQVAFNYASANLFFTDPALVVRGTLSERSDGLGFVLVVLLKLRSRDYL